MSEIPITQVNEQPVRDLFLKGLTLFNSAHFFEAHEVLEDVWRAAPEAERKFFQGLIQIAVALHHHSKGNPVGCRSLLERGRRNLTAYPAHHHGLDLACLRHSIDQWREALDQGRPVPAHPLIKTPDSTNH